VLIEHNTIRTQHYSILNLVRFEDPERASDPFQNLHGFLKCVGIEILLDTIKNPTIPALLLEKFPAGEERGMLTPGQDPLGVYPPPLIVQLR
jgi:hypothetical protein